MTKSDQLPAIVLVNDNWDQLQNTRARLRSKYAGTHSVFGVPSGDNALRLIEALTASGHRVALVAADEHMIRTHGREVLRVAKEKVPGVKTLLTTPITSSPTQPSRLDSNVVDHQHVKHDSVALEAVIDDMLSDWRSEQLSPGVTVIGPSRSQLTFGLNDFLTRNNVAHQQLNGDDPQTVDRLAELGIAYTGEPLVLLPDGRKLRTPTVDELADNLGFPGDAQKADYDLVIIGAGPAGLSAAVYGASEGLSTVVIERAAPGGQAGQSSEIANYFGFPGGIAGAELAHQGRLQAQELGAEFVYPAEVTKLEVDGSNRAVVLDDGTRITTRSVIITTGLEQRGLNVPGAEAMQGRGVYYGAAMSAAATCKNGTAVVVGGANSAGQAALHLSKSADKVVMLIRGDSIESKMSDYLVRRIENRKNIEVRLQTEVLEVHGERGLDHLTLKTPNGPETIEARGMFVFIGAQPATHWLRGTVELDAKGFIKIEDAVSTPLPLADGSTRAPFKQETSVPGVFAAGDSVAGATNRVASAVGHGAEAVGSVHKVLALEPAIERAPEQTAEREPARDTGREPIGLSLVRQ